MAMMALIIYNIINRKNDTWVSCLYLSFGDCREFPILPKLTNDFLETACGTVDENWMHKKAPETKHYFLELISSQAFSQPLSKLHAA